MANTPMEAIVSQTLKGAGNAISKRAGYTYINGSLIPNAISQLPARAIRAGRVIRPGIGMTEKFVSGIDPKAVNSVTVQIMTNAGVHARTVRGNDGAGTVGNDGMINLNPKIIPATSPFEIPLRQLEDQPFFFPQMQLETMLFDETSETIANYYDNINNGMDAYHMAKALSYACHRDTTSGNATTEKSNIVRIDQTKAYDDVYMVKLINKLNALLANGDKQTQLMTFTGPRELVARPELIGWLKSPKTGYILNSDISTKLLMSETFDINEAERYGTQYRGNFAGSYEMQEAPQGLWDLVEQWLGLNVGDLNGVYGIVFTPAAYASGGYGRKEMKLMQSSQYDGVVGFPFVKYGGAAYRMMYVIADESWTMPAKLATVIAPAPVIAPANWGTNNFDPIEKIITDANGTPIGVQTVANVLKPNGDLTVTTLKLTGTANAPVKNALVSATIGSVAIPVTNLADGSYYFLAKQGDSVNVSIEATGFTTKTQTIKVGGADVTINIALVTK